MRNMRSVIKPIEDLNFTEKNKGGNQNEKRQKEAKIHNGF